MRRSRRSILDLVEGKNMYYFSCAKCGNNQAFYRVDEPSSEGLGCLILFFGGILPALLYSDSRKRRVQCGKCGLIFRSPRIPASPITATLGWIVLTVFLSFLLGFILGELSDTLGQSAVVRLLFVLQPLVTSNSYGVAAAILLCAVVTIVVFISIGLAANFRHRRRILSESESEPKEFAAKDNPDIRKS